MTKEKMTVHKALAELKILDKRIFDRIDTCIFCTPNRRTNLKINGVPIETYKKNTLADYNAIKDLMKRRDAIKRAVIQSNATTEVEICGEKYTMAVAIEMRTHGIEYKKFLLKEMSNNFNQSSSTCDVQNNKVASDAVTYVTNLYGNAEVKTGNSNIEASKQRYIEDNSYELVDPIGCKKEIDSLVQEIDAFDAEVDAALSTSNAITEIEIEY